MLSPGKQKAAVLAALAKAKAPKTDEPAAEPKSRMPKAGD